MGTPLEGIKVLELSVAQFGPHCGVMLADMGADVIKVEPPSGEFSRGVPWPHETRGINSYYLAHNRGKRGLAVDYTRPQGREIVYRLAERSDVFLTNYRLGTMERNGLDYETLKGINPGIIYARGTPFGPRGSKAFWPGFDLLGVAASGLMASTGWDDEDRPHPMGAAICDQTASFILAYGIMTALYVRERTGVGQMVDVSLFGSMLSLQSWEVDSSSVNQQAVPRAGRGHPYIRGLWSIFQAGDGWIAIAGVRQDVWHGFCQVMGIQHLEHDPRFENDLTRFLYIGDLVEVLDGIFPARTRDEWVDMLREADVIASPIYNHLEAIADPQARENGYIVGMEYRGHDAVPTQTVDIVGLPVELSETPGRVTTRHPDLGEHNSEVLQELGYTWEDIADLVSEGIIV